MPHKKKTKENILEKITAERERKTPDDRLAYIHKNLGGAGIKDKRIDQ